MRGQDVVQAVELMTKPHNCTGCGEWKGVSECTGCCVWGGWVPSGLLFRSFFFCLVRREMKCAKYVSFYPEEKISDFES